MKRDGSRDLYAELGLGYIPRILALVDRNPLSPTYGCFDKSYWHYKTSDFPSGMYQECVLPLSLVYKYKFPKGDKYYQAERIRELVEAGIEFAASSSHSDGSTDDYYPFEKALGASCFSLYGCTESYIELELENPRAVDFFLKRGSWLLGHQEAGRLSNHQALCALSLYNIYRITGDNKFLEGARTRISLTLEWQSEEGWFYEYEGADPGYQTFTIFYLAKYFQKSGDSSVLEPLSRAVEFASYFIHPDGSYGGEYGSRNTLNFYPCGFEILSAEFPVAAQIGDKFLEGAAASKRSYIEDERIFFHAAGNFLESFLRYNEASRPVAEIHSGQFVKNFSEAGLYVRNDASGYTVISISKGGVIKHVPREGEAISDTGITGRLSDGRIVATNRTGRYESEISENKVSVQGHLGIVKHRLATPLKMALFKVFMVLIGRFFHDAVRRFLQRMLITYKQDVPVWFRRTIDFSDGVKVIDEIRLESPDMKFEKLFAGVDQTTIYVVMSNQFQESNLRPWLDISDRTAELNESGYIKLERVLGKK